MGRRWREAREEQERDIKETARRNGLNERDADEWARKRSERGMERAVNHAIREEGERPIEVNSK